MGSIDWVEVGGFWAKDREFRAKIRSLLDRCEFWEMKGEPGPPQFYTCTLDTVEALKELEGMLDNG